MADRMKREFIPCTMERKISKNVVWRPIKSWHSGVYAGEKLLRIPGDKDASGCMFEEKWHGLCGVCFVPKTYTHRIYWHVENPDHTISAFLSFPDAMGCSEGEYFWEAYPFTDDPERFFGKNAEREMEKKIINKLNGINRARKNRD